jgi:hypothetical protein
VNGGTGSYGAPMKIRTMSAAVLGVLVVSCATHSGVTESRSLLPVSRVILYQNGVGYFERQGTVDDDSFTLRILPTQVNDLLKSLTVIDASDGRAVSVSLPLEKSGDKITSELPAPVRNARGILDVLGVLRGARVDISGAQGGLSGRVVGVEEALIRPKGTNAPIHGKRVVIRSDEGALRGYPISDITDLLILDQALAIGLEQSLDVSRNDGAWKPIGLLVRLAGNESHKILASYIVEMPVWKPAYRLVSEKGGEALLQGWAVVDNVSGEDWNNIQLSLVAGAPMSFIYDLHTPQFVGRRDLTRKFKQRAMAPVVDDPGMMMGGMAQSRSAPSAPSRSRSRSKKSSSAPGRLDYNAPSPAPARAMEMSVAALEDDAYVNVESAKVGALSRYDLQDPVSIPDRSSTLVSIINTKVSGGDVVLFRPNQTGTRGYRSFKLTNNTGVALEQGPVTFYARGTFVGESFLKRMDPNTTTFLTYSGDDTVKLHTKETSSEEGLRLLKAVDGMIESKVMQVSTSTYELHNQSKDDLTVVVKTRRRSGWKFRNQPKGVVETGNDLFVPMEISAGAKKDLKVEWFKPVVRRLAFDSELSNSLLKIYLGSGKVDPGVKKQLEGILQIKRDLKQVDEDNRRIRDQHRTLSTEQDRVRRNLDLLRKTTGNRGLRDRLAKKIESLESKLGKLSGELVKLSDKKAELRKNLDSAIRRITILPTDE